MRIAKTSKNKQNQTNKQTKNTYNSSVKYANQAERFPWLPLKGLPKNLYICDVEMDILKHDETLIHRTTGYNHPLLNI